MTKVVTAYEFFKLTLDFSVYFVREQVVQPTKLEKEGARKML